MNRTEFEQLKSMMGPSEILVEHLNNKTPRTLLVGTLLDSNGKLEKALHIYLTTRGTIARLTYAADTMDSVFDSYSESTSILAKNCIPSKISTVASDFEFCSLMAKAVGHLPISEFAAEVMPQIEESMKLNNGYATATAIGFIKTHPQFLKLTNVTWNYTADDFGLGQKLRSQELVDRLNGLVAAEIERAFPSNRVPDDKTDYEMELQYIHQKVGAFVARYFEIDSWGMPASHAEKLVAAVRQNYFSRKRGVINLRDTLSA
ncbi:flavohemoprotein [Novimethylophilus kurashikiensis]|uniref:Flavohemoprotein n=1 Tax=Novimethylophilus kurashikiensis TaxID=1825523 RepID=A0A2R5F8F4_9PROT|nr:hypothetical protein [Novimethylophilus kurashikiensis]GBG14530.1 flavohemoprotein [Novimethylophilus kurashikiensis]